MNTQTTDPITLPGNLMQTSTPPNSLGTVTCFSNSIYLQTVTVTFNGMSYVFNGTGLGAPMTLDNGDTSFPLNSLPDPVIVDVIFQYSTSGDDNYTNAIQVTESFDQAGNFFVVNISSASDVDGGATFSITTVPASAAQGEPGKTKAGTGEATLPDSSQLLTLHAKTYYNDPEIQGGDEHYIYVPVFTGDEGDLSYSGSAGFTLVSGTVYNQQTPLGGYLHVFVSLQPLPERNWGSDAMLDLSGTLSYWFTFPTGVGSVSWNAVLREAPYEVTRVTN